MAAAEIAAAVADTHSLLFHAAGGARLGAAARRHFARCEERRAITYVPAAVIWECALLARAVRINLRRTTRQFFDDLFTNPAYQPFELNPEQIFIADELRINRDPFDGLICAAAAILDLPLITRDADITSSQRVSVIW